MKVEKESDTVDVRAFSIRAAPLTRSSAGHLAINLLEGWPDFHELPSGFHHLPGEGFRKDRAAFVGPGAAGTRLKFSMSTDAVTDSSFAASLQHACAEGMRRQSKTDDEQSVGIQSRATASAISIVEDVHCERDQQVEICDQVSAHVRGDDSQVSEDSWSVCSCGAEVPYQYVIVHDEPLRRVVYR